MSFFVFFVFQIGAPFHVYLPCALVKLKNQNISILMSLNNVTKVDSFIDKYEKGFGILMRESPGNGNFFFARYISTFKNITVTDIRTKLF